MRKEYKCKFLMRIGIWLVPQQGSAFSILREINTVIRREARANDPLRVRFLLLTEHRSTDAVVKAFVAEVLVAHTTRIR